MKNEIFERYEKTGVVRHGTLLLPQKAAMDFLRECRETGISLLGFDAFRLLPGDRIQPVLEHSVDLSLARFEGLEPDARLQLAEKLLEQVKEPDLVFEMVL